MSLLELIMVIGMFIVIAIIAFSIGFGLDNIREHFFDNDDDED